MKISAVIFDLNGTVLEDEDEYGHAFNKVLKSLGVDSKTDIPHEKGIGVKENWPLLIKKYNIVTNKLPEVLALETQDAYLDEINEINVRPGFIEFTEQLKESGIPIALATSNTWEVVDKMLEALNLRDIFDVITTGDEVTFNKPDPEIFTLTADKLGVEFSQCLVIEDSDSGIVAAKEAGMKVVAFNSEKADLFIENFSELTPKAIDAL